MSGNKVHAMLLEEMMEELKLMKINYYQKKKL